VTLHQADCLDVLHTMPDASVHAIVTDPPYGLADHKPSAIVTALTAWANGDRASVPDGKGFMGRSWDAFVPPPAVWDECLRVLKPGGHMLVFAGTRTVDLMGLSVRMAGFEIRDSISWLYGSGFPKSLDVSKAIDKAAGATRVQIRATGGLHNNANLNDDGWSKIGASVPMMDGPIPATDAARAWSGWGTALKPASEPIIVARKPLSGTVAANVLEHGCGGINVDGCRVPAVDKAKFPAGITSTTEQVFGGGAGMYADRPRPDDPNTSGRWPANVVISHGPGCAEQCQPGCPATELDAQSGISKDGVAGPKSGGFGGGMFGDGTPDNVGQVGYGGSGGASRFFPVFKYQAKAPTKERPKVDGKSHPTVKPLELMRWLVRLVTPPGGTVLDPFAGSGTTGQAAALEGFECVLIEFEADHIPLIEKRLTDAEISFELVVSAPVAEVAPEPTLLDLIAAADGDPEMTALWEAHQDEWTDEHTAAVRARLQGVAA
jgi:site-specific DNA-methyltransferase (adenine-specific)